MIILGVVASQQSGEYTGTPEPISANWRVFVHETAELGPLTPASIAELVWLDENGDPLDITGANFTANHFDGGNVPGAAFDSDPATYWSGFRDDGTTFGTTPWLATEFTEEVEVRGLKIAVPETNLDQSPREFSIQFLSPGGSWVTLFKVVAQVSWASFEERSYQLGGRVWRMVVNTTDEGTKVAVGEIEFRSTVDVGDTHGDDGGFALSPDGLLPESRFYAFDSDPETIWESDHLPATVEYWFQTSHDLAQIAVFAVPGREDEVPLTAQLFYSDDYGLTFTEADPAPPIITVSGGYGNAYGYYYGGSA